MSEVVNVYEAKTQLSRLLDRAVAGEDIVIARAGRPLVRLTPVTRQPRRRPGLFQTLKVPEAFFDPLPADDQDADDADDAGIPGA
jgi:prevent-host-death family protein